MPRREPGQRRLPSGKWQVFVRVKAPGDTRSRFLSTTFPADSLVTDRRRWRERVRLDARVGTALTPLGETTFAEDADRYLESVAALPTIQQRRQHIQEWVVLFAHRPRVSIRPHEIRAQRDRWLTEPRTDQQGRPRPPYAAGSVNKRLRALSNLWRVLDGRHAPNPVREVPEADEIEGKPRALPYGVIQAILEAMPDVTRGPTWHPARRREPDQGEVGRHDLDRTPPTGQLAGLRRDDIDWQGPSLWVRGRRKGAAGPGTQGSPKADPGGGDRCAPAVRRPRLLGRLLTRLDAQESAGGVPESRSAIRAGWPRDRSEPGSALRLPPLVRDRAAGRHTRPEDHPAIDAPPARPARPSAMRGRRSTRCLWPRSTSSAHMSARSHRHGVSSVQLHATFAVRLGSEGFGWGQPNSKITSK